MHLWTQDTYACGDEQKVEAPVGEPPVFYLQGSDWGGKLAEFVQTLA